MTIALLRGQDLGSGVRCPSVCRLRWLIVVVGVAGCVGIDGARHTDPPRPTATDPLAIRYDAASFREVPALPARLAKTPFAYFRYVNRPFAEEVCNRYAAHLARMPEVNLHGDAHLEQYAVAVDGRGLADFDAAAVGPPIIDLVRFATSLLLARPDDEAGGRASIEAFLRGYSHALAAPDVEGPEPKAAARIRGRFLPNAEAWLAGAEALMVAPDPSELPRLRRGYAPYVSAMLAQNPGVEESFFRPKAAGLLKSGIGSAHEKKFLLRAEGPSPRNDDDVVLEVKQVERGSIARCVHGPDGDAARIIRGQTRISSAPQKFLGTVSMDDKTFYVHAWRVHYTELTIGDLRDATELAEIAYDVGLQLGRGHPKQIGDARGTALCATLRQQLPDIAASIYPTARGLRDRVLEGHRAFVMQASAARTGTPSP